MSLILEALKKLERDRHTQERGFLVLAAPADGAAARHWTRPAALAAVAALGGAVLTAALLRPSASPRAQAVSATPAPAAIPLPAAAIAEAPMAPRVPEARVAWPAASAAAGPKPTRSAAPQPTAGANAAPDTVAAPAPDEEPAGVAAADEQPADASAIEPPATLHLQAISQRDGQPVAVISGQVVRAGDRIGASTVVRIGVGEVEIETDGVRRMLRF